MRKTGVTISARFSVRDFLLLLALLGVGGDTYWCWEHGREIRKLQIAAQEIKPQPALPGPDYGSPSGPPTYQQQSSRKTGNDMVAPDWTRMIR